VRRRPPARTRPYDLRHSYASLRIQEDRLSIVELAEQLGHSAPTRRRTGPSRRPWQSTATATGVRSGAMPRRVYPVSSSASNLGRHAHRPCTRRRQLSATRACCFSQRSHDEILAAAMLGLDPCGRSRPGMYGEFMRLATMPSSPSSAAARASSRASPTQYVRHDGPSRELVEQLAPVAIRQRSHGTATRVQQIEDHQRGRRELSVCTPGADPCPQRREVGRAVRRKADEFSGLGELLRAVTAWTQANRKPSAIKGHLCADPVPLHLCALRASAWRFARGRQHRFYIARKIFSRRPAHDPILGPRG
jgi:hypothetical protein